MKALAVLAVMVFIFPFSRVDGSSNSSGNPHVIYLNIDSEKSQIKWKTSNGENNLQGTIKVYSGNIADDHGNLVSGEVVLDMKSIESTDAKNEKEKKKLNEHLKAEKFFNVAEFPMAKLVIYDMKAWRGEGDATHVASAKLTFKGITNEITFPLNFQEHNDEFVAHISFFVDGAKWGIVNSNDDTKSPGTGKGNQFSFEADLYMNY